jgi:2'-5' RNA ligase
MMDNKLQAISDFLEKALLFARSGGDLERLTGKADYSDGVMVAFYLPASAAQSLVTLGETAPDDLHLTLAYLGTVTEQTATLKDLVAALAEFARDAKPVYGTINGTGRFSNVEDDGTNAIVALFDSPDLPQWRQRLVETLGWTARDVKVSDQHGFIPHITLRYIAADQPTPALTLPMLRLVFDTVYLVWGEQRIPFKLQGMTVETVEAFLNAG